LLTKIINMFNIKPQNSKPYTTKNYVIHMCINTLILLNTRSRDKRAKDGAKMKRWLDTTKLQLVVETKNETCLPIEILNKLYKRSQIIKNQKINKNTYRERDKMALHLAKG